MTNIFVSIQFTQFSLAYLYFSMEHGIEACKTSLKETDYTKLVQHQVKKTPEAPKEV